MDKEKLQDELDGLKLTLNNIKQKDKFALNEFFDAVYDLQDKTVTQSRINTPQALTGVDLLTEEQAEQITTNALDNRGVTEVAELLEKFEGVDGVNWYGYDNDTKHLYNAAQDYAATRVIGNIQTAING